MIIGITGSRPQSLGGFQNYELFAKIKTKLKELFFEHQPDAVISGMALGIDTFAAEIAIELQIKLICAAPFIGQELRWNTDNQEHYQYLLKQASKIEIISDGGFSVEKLFIRNEWIVDNSDMLIAFQSNGSSGTQHCIDYAKDKNRSIILIDPIKDL